MTFPDPVAALRRPGTTLAVLIRHGRTAWNAEGRFLGRTDLALDEVGREQVRSLALTGRRFDAVYTSPLRRASDTAVALGPPAAVPLPALVEAHQGELEGLIAAEALPRWPTFFEAFASDPDVRIPGGETLTEVRDRMFGALEQVRADHPGASIALVSHQLAIATVVATLQGQSPAAWRAWRLDHCEGFVLRGGSAGWEVAGRLPACEIAP
jgi:broad specificity phosphatase PhoE